MHRLQFHYRLSRQPDLTPQLHNELMRLLRAVANGGSISAAARALGLSYRHVWGELRRWEVELGGQLVQWEKGQRARLSELGDKLLWAEAQAQARLAPQIEALRAELERGFAIAFDAQTHVVTLAASHDHALTALREHALSAATAHVRVHLDIRFCGSVDAIRALNEGRCTLAGFHLPSQPQPGSLAEQTYRPLLQPGLHKLIGFATRSQGLMVAPGNPLRLHSLADVVTRSARFVNRTLGSGTRLLLDAMLAEGGLSAEQLHGYTRTESTHTAAAHAVLAGQADVALGTAAAAQACALDFVPLLQEDYHLVCLKSELEQPSMQALLRLLYDDAWTQRLQALAGYRAAQPGQVQSLRALLPWWTFVRKKRR